jgi:GxxExxY protein
MTGGTALAELRLVHGDLTREIIGAFYDVYNGLGFGFVESVYQRAIPVALAKRGVQCAREVPMDVQFEGVEVGVYRADLIVDGKVIVECKVAEKIVRVHELQLLNYLRATGLSVGLILNFGHQATFRRLLLTSPKEGSVLIRS